MRNLKTTGTAVALFAFTAAAAAADQKNTTGLPNYPHIAGGLMDGIFRSLPNGQHCISFMSQSADSLSAVEDWYKKQLPDAKIEDINHNSLFGSYFKLSGIKLLSGNDLVNIYADTDNNKTTIDLYKCRDPARPAS